VAELTPPIVLVTPPSPFLLDERTFLSLGILKVGSALRARGFPVEMLDLSGVYNFEEAVSAHAATTSAKVFGVTATSPQMPHAKRILDAVKRTRPDMKCVLGGPHPTLVLASKKREEKMQRSARGHRALAQLVADWDQIVAGDGEISMVEIMQGLSDRVVDADDPTSALFLKKGQLEELPWPARDLVDMLSYHYSIDGFRATSLIAQLGCPYACRFCAGRYSPFLRRVRTRSTAAIVAEVEHIYKTYGHVGFMFYDDELNVSKTMVELMNALTDLQSRLGVEFRLRGFVKSELFTDTQAVAMRQAGFRWLLCGYESGSERILGNIDKKATRDENTKCVEIAHAAGLKVKALMSLGHAGETPETCQATEDWLLEVQPDDFDLTIITPYPGSPYYDDAIETAPHIYTFTHDKTGDRLHGHEIDYNVTSDYYKGSPDGGYVCYVYTDAMSAADLVAERDRIEAGVRGKLKIPYNTSQPALKYETSMGMTALPSFILRKSVPAPPSVVHLSVVD
jgi:radical SAM superfamily enzyme YgiQ (UPF0313 family)